MITMLEMMRTMFVTSACVAFACTMAWGQEGEYYESFEDGVPAYFTAARAGSLSISPWHSKHGKSSLRWEWSSGEALVIQHGIGDVSRAGGFLCRASFVVWVYVEKPISGAVVFELREGETVTGSFPFPLGFTGWRQARVFYDQFPTGKPTAKVDNIRVSSPPNVARGTVFLDFIAFPEERTLDQARPHWFLDVQQTGYYLPAGQNVTVVRKHQTSRDVNDLENTEGDFLTAWIDHGRAPSSASYEYLLVVRATSEAMRGLAAEPPYRVIQRDQAAHIVWDTEGRRWGSVFFVPQEVTPHTVATETLPIKTVDRPCLIMAEAARDGQLDVSVADPDLNLEEGVSQPRPLRVALRGAWRLLDATGTVCAWRLPDASENVRILSTTAAETVMEILYQHGASYDVKLAR